MKKIYVLMIALIMTSLGFGQTTVSYDFSSGGAVSGLNQSSPGITIDTNIGFGSFKNSGTSNPGIFSNQLRLYQNATKGGSIIIYANNGVTITDIVINASSRTGPAGYTVDGGTATNLSGSSPYTISGISATSEVEFYQRDSNSSNRIYVDSFEVTYTSAGGCTAPTTQASAYNTTSISTTSATLNWTSGNGNEVLVVVKEGSAVDTDPTDGTSYTGNTVFASGDQIGTNNYVVHSGSSVSSVSTTGLTPGTMYHVAVYEYNTLDTCYNLTELTGSFTTDCLTPTDVTTITALSDNATVDLSWLNDSCFDEILVVAKATSAVTVTPTGDGTAYTANATFGSGTDLGTGEFAVYKGTGASVTVTGLTNGTTYHFEVFARKTTTWSAGVVIDATPNNLICNSIFSDDFSTDLSQWSNTTDWAISSGELKHDLSGTSGSSYIYTDIGTQDLTATAYEWEFCVRNGSWDPSGSNKFAFFLLSNASNLLSSPTGYAVGVNQTGSSDLLTLYSVNNGSYTGIITSSFNWGTSDNVCVKVTRNASGEWELLYDDNGSGEVSAGTTTNTTHTSGDYLGATFNYTSSRAGLLWFDDVNVCKEIIAPTTYTYNGTWSPNDPNGMSASTDIIIVTSGNAIISSNTDIDKVTVDAGATISVNSGVTLTVNGTEGVMLNSTSTSYSSLILDGTITGTVKYNRYVNNNHSVNGNDLISAPLSGQAFNTFIANNSNIRANPNGPEVLFGGYDNTSSTNPFELWNENATTPLTAGKGYRSGITEGESSNLVTFEGIVNTSLVQTPINQGSVSKLNLIGNPFPSYLDAQLFLSHNSSLLDPSAIVIYGYNDSTDGSSAGDYTIISALINTNIDIAPGQAFFVASNVSGGNIEFTTSSSDMRLATGGDDFIAGRSASATTNLKLDLSSATDSFITDIFFTEYSTQGLDPGYDASLLGGNAPEFALYSHLVQENTGIPFAVQALGKIDYNDIIIPLGVNANQGEQLSFSIDENSLPSTVEVYLDDNVTNTTTLLNTTDYILTPNMDLNGTGRFYLRLTNNALSTIDNNLDNLNIYNNHSNKTIVIAGQLLEATTAKIYDVQGRLISTTLLQNTDRIQNLDVSSLNAGIYVVQLVNRTQNKTQKVIIH